MGFVITVRKPTGSNFVINWRKKRNEKAKKAIREMDDLFSYTIIDELEVKEKKQIFSFNFYA